MSTFNLLEWEPLVSSGKFCFASIVYVPLDALGRNYADNSSAKDQLSGTSVAIKKIMKPFSTPVLSKRTYRELKLLKHLRHENVS